MFLEGGLLWVLQFRKGSEKGFLEEGFQKVPSVHPSECTTPGLRAPIGRRKWCVSMVWAWRHFLVRAVGKCQWKREGEVCEDPVNKSFLDLERIRRILMSTLLFQPQNATPQRQYTPIQHLARGRLWVDSWSIFGQLRSKMTKTDQKLTYN